MNPPKEPNTFKPPLITPSASPPHSRPWIANSVSGRHPDNGLPPFKRARSSATPRPSSSSSSSAITSHVPATDFHKERQASAMRLLTVWSQLAERYTRRLDEDDIVDLGTLKIIKDNGVTRGIGRVDFGSISEAQEGSRDDEGEEEDEEEDNVDDIDELDTLTRVDSDREELESLEAHICAKPMPPVSPMNPIDAEDLKEFMEAEQRRKDLCGSEPEDDIEEYTDGVAETNISFHDRDDSSTHATDLEDIIEDTGDYSRSNSGSDDELANWDDNEASAVYEVVRPNADASEDVSDIEVIEGPVYKSTKLKKQDTASPIDNHQLKTPPESQNSPGPSGSSSSSDFFGSLPPSSPPPSSSPFEIRSSSLSPPTTPSVYSSPPGKIFSLGSSGSRTRGKTPGRAIGRSGAGRPQLSRAMMPSEAGPSSDRSHPKTPTGVADNSEPGYHQNTQILRPAKNAPVSPSTDRRREKTSRGATVHSKTHNHKTAQVSKVAKDTEETPSPGRTRAKTPIRATKTVHSEASHHQATSKPGNAGPSTVRAKTPSRSSVKPEVVIVKRKAFSSCTIEPEDPSEFEDLPPPPPRTSRSASPVKKRKRASTSSESSESILKPRSPNGSKNEGKTKSRYKQRPDHDDTYSSSDSDSYQQNRSTRTRSRSMSHHVSSESDTSAGSSHNEHSQLRRSRSSKPKFNAVPPYPYMPPPSTHHFPSQYPPQPRYAPIQDPRAQMIVAQAMQQLSALVGWGTPSGVPYTPSRRHGHDGSEVIYSTPTHHMFPYMFDPNMSNATLPPDSPNPQSSPDRTTSRKKSLVRRSRSRGRRVSFKIDDNDDDDDSVGIQSSPIRPSMAQRRMNSKGKGKGKAKAASDAEQTSSEGELSTTERRSTRNHLRRGHTPGPSTSDGKRGRKQPSTRRRRRESLSVDDC